MKARIVAIIVAAAFSISRGVEAHIVVEPYDSAAGEVINYTVRIPSHLDATTVAVELEIPQGLEMLSIAKTLGGNVMRKAAIGATIVRWVTKIPADERGEVSFTARNPAVPTELVWKAHQIYDNGVTIDWVEPRGKKQPASVTRVIEPAGIGK